MSRLETLRNRYDRIVGKYIGTVKQERYFETLYKIKNEIYKIEAENRAKNKNSELSIFLKKTKGLNGSQILRLAN